MSAPAKLYIVDGRRTTIAEAAALVGISRKAMYATMRRHAGTSLQMIVDMYRKGDIGTGKRAEARHCIHGEWMTTTQAAEQLGTSYAALVQWRVKHRRPDGSPALLEECVDHYEAVRAGHIKRYVGSVGRGARYWVRGRKLTMAQAAEKYGLNEMSLRRYVYRHGCSVQTACEAMAALKARRAELAIMKILREGSVRR